MTWVSPQFSREQVRRAGREFINRDASPADREAARAIINNWRSAHRFPLNSVQMVLRNKVRRFSSGDPVVAQRTKRLPSIVRKLERFERMDLPRMHDIGGCRAVVESIDEVRAIEASYVSGKSRSRNLVGRHDDYIANPKPDGYRGVHVVVNYQGEEQQKVWAGLRIEVQLRTRVQHAWATALETVDTFTKQALKSNVGDPEWMRFFALMGAEIAHREGQPLVRDTPIESSERRDELGALAETLRVVQRLTAYGQTVRVLEEEVVRKGERHFLLDLNIPASSLNVRTYANAAAAEDAYGLLEGEAQGERDVVLVAVSSMAALRRAYPNYFLDTSAFVGLVEEVVRPSRR